MCEARIYSIDESTSAQQNESTFILYLVFVCVNEEQRSDYLKNEISVCSCALESIDLICTSKATG